MRVRRILLAGLLLAAAAALAAGGGAANSAGAPDNSSKSGCTCHSPQPSLLAQTMLAGVPDRHTPGQTYNLTLTVGGNVPAGLNNQGGFALSADGGNLSGLDDRTQVKKGMITHTATGNDQRSWAFTWTAPLEGNESVTFSFAANAVDGNGVADPGDQWVRATVASTRSDGATAPTSPLPAPTPSEQKTPTLSLAGLVVAIVAVAAHRRMRVS